MSFSSNFERTDFQMWHKRIKEIFNNYELGNKLYKDEFDKLSFKRDQFNGSLRFTQKYFFNHDLEKARYILTKIIKDIDIYGVEFIEVEGKVKEKVVYKTKPKSMKCFLIDTPICNKDIIEQPSWVFQVQTRIISLNSDIFIPDFQYKCALIPNLAIKS